MDSEMQEAVLKLLRNSDTIDKLTRIIIRKSSPVVRIITSAQPKKNTGMKLSAPVYKDIVHEIVETYLTEQEWNKENRIERAVVKFLRDPVIIDKVSDYIIRKSPSNLSAAPIRKVVESYLARQQVEEKEDEVEEKEDEDEEKEDEVEEKEDEDEGSRKKKMRYSNAKECDDEGGVILAKLSRIRKVTIAEFGGKPFVSISEYSKQDGKEIPTTNGVSLTCEEWEACSLYLTATGNAIKKMEGRLSRFDDLCEE